MTWQTLKPENTGGGRQPKTPAGKLYGDGQLTINHAAAALLGYPDRVVVQVEPNARRIRLSPTTPTDAGGFALSGGGNTPHRIRCTAAVNRWPHLVGDYAVFRVAGGIELRSEAKDDDDEDGELIL